MFYYNNAANDGDLGNVDNWWNDAGFTTPAGVVPGTFDDAIVTADASLAMGGGYSFNSLTITGGVFSASGASSIVANTSVTIASGGTVAAGASITSSIFSITGTGLVTGGTLIGNVTANGNSASQVTGATVTGNITFAGNYTDALPDNAGGSVSGTTYFSGTVTFSGANNSVSPTWTDAGSTWTFNGRANSGTFTCAHCAMTNSSTNAGTITITGGGTVSFDGGSTNEGGTVTGNASFTAGLANQTGTVTGDITIPSTHAFTQAQLGTFGGQLLITAPASGGGGPLGGPGIIF